MRGLIRKGYIVSGVLENDRDESYPAYSMTPEGFLWLEKQQDKLELRKPTQMNPVASDADIPF